MKRNARPGCAVAESTVSIISAGIAFKQTTAAVARVVARLRNTSEPNKADAVADVATKRANDVTYDVYQPKLAHSRHVKIARRFLGVATCKNDLRHKIVYNANRRK